MLPSQVALTRPIKIGGGYQFEERGRLWKHLRNGKKQRHGERSSRRNLPAGWNARSRRQRPQVRSKKKIQIWLSLFPGAVQRFYKSRTHATKSIAAAMAFGVMYRLREQPIASGQNIVELGVDRSQKRTVAADNGTIRGARTRRRNRSSLGSPAINRERSIE